jgi:purine-binding chemotaxis protein CheW
MKMDSPNPLHAVVFRVGGLVCALPAGEVREILPAGPATRIPGAPEAVQGLVNVRGRLVTVVDAHAVLGQLPSGESALLLVDRRGRTAGLVVGEVLDFLELPPAARPGRAALAGGDERTVAGVGEWGGQRLLLLDSDVLLAPLLGA